MPDLISVIELLLIALAVALLTRRTNRPYTIALVIWGLALGLLHIFEPVQLTKEMVLAVFLPPLLFEGALHTKKTILRKRSGAIFGMAIAGTLLTALIVGGATTLLLDLDILVALLLGVIIAPTDPISVLATFKQSNVDEELATIVEGESLFNDGIAVVLYVILLGAIEGSSLNLWVGLGTLLTVMTGGALIGLVIGFLTTRLMKNVDDHLVETLTTLIAAYGAYLLAEQFHVSGVIAVVLAGIVVGNRGLNSTANVSRRRLTDFWEIVAFLANSIVFLLIGFELQPDQLAGTLLWALLIFVILMAGRAALTYTLGAIIHRKRGDLPLSWRHVIVWGGIRGAVPVALALGLPVWMPARSDLVGIIFGVVLFSLLGQGLSISGLLRRLGITNV